MKIENKIPTLTTPELKEMCELARTLNFDHVPASSFWDEVDPDGVHPICLWMEHRPDLSFWELMAKVGRKHEYNFAYNNGVNIRAVVDCAKKHSTERLILDFDQKDFMERYSAVNIVADGQHRTQVT